MPLPFPPIARTARLRAVAHPVVLLVWHDIVATKKLVWFDTTIAEFEQQLNRLKKAGAHPIALSALYNYLRTGKPEPPPGACVLCFDDNTRGIYRFAAQRLREREWPFVVSAHTSYIGITTSKEHSTFAELQAMEIAGATIVSQTHTHPPDLRTLSAAALKTEFVVSRQRLEEGLRHSVDFVTYPSGKWDSRVAQAAADAGYRMGLTEDYGPAEQSPHLLAIRRFSTHRRIDLAVRTIARSAKT